MKHDDKIVSIDALRDASTQQGANAAVAPASLNRRMSAATIALRDFLQRSLAKQLQTMFDGVDDALFDLAETAPSNQQQNVFFESMREIRFKRVEIERDFIEQFQRSYLQLFSDSNAANRSQHSSKNSPESLALLDEDIVEEMVAVDSMVAKFDKQLAAPMHALEARLAHLVAADAGAAAAADIFNPVCPKQLCQSFSSACRILSVDIKARIVLFKWFEKTLLASLDSIYTQANERLIRAKILPDYIHADYRNSTTNGGGYEDDSAAAKASIVASADARSFTHTTTNPAAIVRAGGQALSARDSQQLNELSQLMTFASQYERGVALEQSSPLASALQLLHASAQPVIQSEVLWQLLNSLQKQQSASITDSTRLNIAMQRPEDLLHTLSGKLVESSDSVDASIGQRERDVIGLVSMLFQFVLDDRVVSEPMKAALSRLQVPIIKVAINESNFFCSPSHPARKLLNEMTDAVVGWVAVDNYQVDPLYQIVCGTVERITREYDTDSQLFFDVLADFKSWLANDDKRNQLRSKRVVDAEAGRDESNRARDEVKQFIESLDTQGQPEFIIKLIDDAWSNIMFLAYVHNGADGDHYKALQSTLETLLWTVSPRRCGRDRADLLKKLPPLLAELRKGLASINYNVRASGDFFEQLERAHMQVMKRSSSLPLQTKPRGASDNSSTPIAKPAVAPIPVPAESQWLTKAKSMSVGQWIELKSDSGKKRCRLVAILRNSGKRIFVSRTGSKAAELDATGIADLLESGEMTALDDAQLFDKALTSIIDGLRKQHSEALGA